MSFTMMAKAKPVKTGHSGRKLVLMMLADIADDNGKCFPSYQHLADCCEMTRRSVITHVNALKDSGLVSIEHREGPKGNSSNIFTLHLPSEAVSPDPSENISPPSENLALPPSENSSPRTYHSPYPINEPVEKKRKRFVPPTLDDVRVYFYEKGEQCSVEPAKFHSYYESNGWMVGRNKMKNWKSAATNWMARNQGNQQQRTGYSDKQIQRKQVTAALMDIHNTDW